MNIRQFMNIFWEWTIPFSRGLSVWSAHFLNNIFTILMEAVLLDFDILQICSLIGSFEEDELNTVDLSGGMKP